VRIEANALRVVLSDRPAVKALIHEHTYTLMRQILYSASCNRLHSMEERCARWLLMTHDRAGEDTFPITQELLGHMLGVRRATVNVAIGMLKKAGFIRYVRGRLTVADRPGLESASCECYLAIVRAHYPLLPKIDTPSPRAS
jgi:CRP-like cAMP-binding protein